MALTRQENQMRKEDHEREDKKSSRTDKLVVLGIVVTVVVTILEILFSK